MKLVKTYEEGEYTINEYDNGATEKFQTGFPPKVVQPPILTEEQELIYQTAVNIELIASMMELEGGLT